MLYIHKDSNHPPNTACLLLPIETNGKPLAAIGKSSNAMANW